MGCRPFTELNFSPSLWQAVSEKEEKEGRIPNPKSTLNNRNEMFMQINEQGHLEIASFPVGDFKLS
ncbi:MAG TPA: hypothetical protein DDX86_06050 [Akkermansia sp.]|nr:hypothetical protein [Akkermansia sp.]